MLRTPIRDRSARAWRAAGLVAVLAGAVSLAVSAGAASAAEPLDFTMEFTELRPSETRTDVAYVELDRDATLISSAWEERSGILEDASLEVVVCDDAVCYREGERGPMAAGTLSVSVTVTVGDDLPEYSAGAALGRLQFVDDDSALPATGSSFSAAAAAAGVAAIIAGGVAVAVSSLRPRRGPAR